MKSQKSPGKHLRKGLRAVVISIVSLVVVAGSAAAYYVFDLLGNAGHTDVDIVDKVTVPPGSLDEITLPPEDPTDPVEPTADPSAPGVSSAPAGQPRIWGYGRCAVYVVPSIQINKVAQKDPNVTNILVYGVDARSASTLACRTDTMMIVTIDSDHNAIKLTSLMRDTQVAIAGRTLPNKLNSPYVFGGIGLFINTINETFDLDIQDFVMIDFWSAEKVIQMAGGVTIDVKAAEIPYLNRDIDEANSLFRKVSTQSPWVTVPGLQLLDGRQAVAYGRIRKLDSDHQRTARQRYVMKQLLAAFWKASASQKNDTLQAALGAINTNMTDAQMLSVALGTLVANPTAIQEYKVPQSGLYTEDPATYNLVMNLPAQVDALHRFIWSTGPATPPSPTPEPSPSDTPAPPTESTGTPTPDTASPTSGPTATEDPTPITT